MKCLNIKICPEQTAAQNYENLLNYQIIKNCSGQKQLPILYSKLLHKMGNYFLDI